jgi:hypothetical protein
MSLMALITLVVASAASASEPAKVDCLELAPAQRNECALAQEQHRAEALTAAGAGAARAALSVELCVALDERQQVKAEIARERHYTAESGVADVAHRRELRERLEARDEVVADARADLRARGLRPLSCTNRQVVELRACWADKNRKGCDGDGMRAGLALLDD